jgi:hypothetical protein
VASRLNKYIVYNISQLFLRVKLGRQSATTTKEALAKVLEAVAALRV